MNIFHKSKAETLAEWLELATKKLESAAKERIRAEIEAHYAETVDGYINGGFSGPEAQVKALADLGNARTAARRFRRQHLTKGEVKRSKSVLRLAGNVFYPLLHYLFFIFITGGTALSWHRYPRLFLILEAFVLICLPSLCFILAKFGKQEMKRHIFLLWPMSHFYIGLALNGLFNREHQWGLPVIASVLLILSIAVLTSLRLWNKLGTVTANPSENPPGKAVQD